MRADAQMRAAWASIKHHLPDYPGSEWALETFEEEIDFREPEVYERDLIWDILLDPTRFLGHLPPTPDATGGPDCEGA